jgi:hypothetical protein
MHPSVAHQCDPRRPLLLPLQEWPGGRDGHPFVWPVTPRALGSRISGSIYECHWKPYGFGLCFDIRAIRCGAFCVGYLFSVEELHVWRGICFNRGREREGNVHTNIAIARSSNN